MIQTCRTKLKVISLYWSLAWLISLIFVFGDENYGIELTVIAITTVLAMWLVGLLLARIVLGSSKIVGKSLLSRLEKNRKEFEKQKEGYLSNCKEYAWQALRLISFAYKCAIYDQIEFLNLEAKRSQQKLSKISKKRLAFLTAEQRTKIEEAMKEDEDTIRGYKNQIKTLETEAMNLKSFMIEESMFD